MKLFKVLKICIVFLAFFLVACGTDRLEGRYRLALPPQTGETVVEEVEFSGVFLIMRSGLVEQKVKYELHDDILTIFTNYGDFSFSFEQRSESIIIDSIEYIMEK